MEGLRHKLFKKLKENTGAGEIKVAILFLAMMIIFSVIFEYVRVQIYASNVRDSFERAILTVASENYNEVYAGFREIEIYGGEYAGGPAGGDDSDAIPEWIPIYDRGNVADELMELLALDEIDSGRELTGEYDISDILILVKDSYSGGGRYDVRGEMKLRLPVYFLGVIEQHIELNIVVKTGYTAKY